MSASLGDPAMPDLLAAAIRRWLRRRAYLRAQRVALAALALGVLAGCTQPGTPPRPLPLVCSSATPYPPGASQGCIEPGLGG